jgi:hypothetical protein
LKHFILPREASADARFILLRHPRDSTLQRFLICPQKGLFQFTKIEAPQGEPRSLLFADAGEDEEKGQKTESAADKVGDGYVSKSAEFFVATPFDVAFILIPLVVLPAVSGDGKKNLFQPLDDILEQHVDHEGGQHLRHLLLDQGRTMAEEAMSRFCDAIEAGDERMYRPSDDKLLRMVVEKVERVMQVGLPASLEEKFVTRALETPILGVKREDSTTSLSVPLPSPDETDSASENADSQSTAASSAPSAVFSETSSLSTTSSSVGSTLTQNTVSQDLLDLQKQSVILDYLLASYVPKSIADRLRARFDSKESSPPIDFAPLQEHLKSLAALRAEAVASRSIGDYSRKRGLDDEEAAELRAEKKRRLEEEERKKKLGESRGVRDLKKVNVVGMKKMSDFFAKKPAAKAKG